MRAWLQAHAHSAASFAVILSVAMIFGAALDTAQSAGTPLSAVPSPPIDIPPQSIDRDLDTYADDVDLVDGDAHVRLSVERLSAGDVLPYVVVGTQDDHWRLGQGRELEWRHIVDPDPLGHRPGSGKWIDDNIRTGAWWYSIPMDGAAKAMAPTGEVPDGGLPGISWPQVFHVNIREDAPEVRITLEVVDASPNPDARLAAWTFVVATTSGNWSVEGILGNAGERVTLVQQGIELDIRVDAHAGIPREDKLAMATRWAPEVRYDEEERFFPTSGDAMALFHGFSRTAPANHDLRTWTRDFNNGRDAYVLLLADFNGDGRVDHEDVAVMTDILRAGSVAPDTVYAHVTDASGDRVVIQYWFLYMYNYVEDEQGRPIEILAHRGDREFMQLTFDSREDALSGQPRSIAYSQHYRGIKILEPDFNQEPWNGHPVSYPARGSHASYPAPGDDRRFRSALSGFGDKFDGQGEHWTIEDYNLTLFDRQEWAFGHLWGPVTRHSRDLGTSAKPLLQHSFSYPYIDPVAWEERQRVLDQDDLRFLYGGES